MKHIHVACAIIEVRGKVLCTQRSESMSLPLKWEFPCAKINEGESHEECHKRELAEELGVEELQGLDWAEADGQVIRSNRGKSVILTI